MKELLGYATASACAFLVDLSIFWVLVHFLAWAYLTAATISFLSGSVVAYQLSTTIAFNQHRLTNRKVEFAGFVAIGGLGLLINGMLIYVGANVLGLHYLIAKCIASGFTFANNFFLRRQMLFVHRAVF